MAVNEEIYFDLGALAANIDMQKEIDVMSQEIHKKPDGNTKTSGSKNQLYRWTFTIPCSEYTASQLSQELGVICKKFVFQGERAPSTGYEHWQGCLSLRQKEYFATVKNYLCDSAHIEPCLYWIKSQIYCRKPESRFCGPYDENSTFLDLPEILYPWQQDVLKLVLTKPDDRTIHWWYDASGCKGKTIMCKILMAQHGASVISNGTMRDIAFAVKSTTKIVCFNFTRSNEDRINYGAIEACKDGLLFSGKYESCSKIFNSPHVLVFANFLPNLNTMSSDRWNIITM